MPKFTSVAPEMYELLKEIEWRMIVIIKDKKQIIIRKCLVCHSYELDGHKSDCKLAIVLKKVE